MVLNGKAELVAKLAPAAKTRYEQVELCIVLSVLLAAGTLSWQLYINMVEGWQMDPHKRWHVLTLSSSLLVLSIVACVYLCHRLQPTVRLHSADPAHLWSSWDGLSPAFQFAYISAPKSWLSFCPHQRGSRILRSVNSQLHLILSERDRRPPSYEAVARWPLSQPPPPYSEVISV